MHALVDARDRRFEIFSNATVKAIGILKATSDRAETTLSDLVASVAASVPETTASAPMRLTSLYQKGEGTKSETAKAPDQTEPMSISQKGKASKSKHSKKGKSAKSKSPKSKSPKSKSISPSISMTPMLQ
jgi:hypothetical protein